MEKKISQIREEFEKGNREEWYGLIRIYENDCRSGVKTLLGRYQKKLDDWKKEEIRLEGMLKFERMYPDLTYICGIDEAGRGPLAGPVVAGAVILPKDFKIPYLNDSKQLSAARRDQLYDEIMKQAVSVGVGMASPARIDEINILQATYEAMRQAIDALSERPQILLNDAVRIPEVEILQVPIVKGDSKSLSIAAASVIAKVTRDRLMMEYDTVMPEYGFAGHKGYGSAAHIAAIKKYGPSPIHRASFIKNFVEV